MDLYLFKELWMLNVRLSFTTLLLLISFASVNAVLFTPALPDIAHYFSVSEGTAQKMITWFLIGYALGQLVYGPLANRFGRKPALYIGITLQIISSLVCVLAGVIKQFPLLVFGRLMLALGAGVGLKMTFTLVNECYGTKEASQKISYLMLAFAITPALAVALGGLLNSYFGWLSCFYAGALYGLLLLMLVTRFPETQKTLDYKALYLSHLVPAYIDQFKNLQLIAGGLLMGICTTFVYVFAAIAPFIAINIFGMQSSDYGVANLLPPIGLIVGSLVAAKLAMKFSLGSIIKLGIWIAIFGTLFMFSALILHLPVIFSMFTTVIVIYFGLCFILANASSLAMRNAEDKAHGSAVMNFINMSTATVITLSVGFFKIESILLPICYFMLCALMLVVRRWLH